MVRTRVYRSGVLAAEGFPVDEVSEHLAVENAVLWVDLVAPDRADLDSLSGELGLHHLAVEDALQAGQRPKLDRYESHLFATLYNADLDRESGRLTAHEIGIFITPRALVTVRRHEDFDIDEVARRWDRAPDLAEHGVAFLLHGLLDYAVDTFFDASQVLDQEIEALEDHLFSEATTDSEVQRRTFALRKSLMALRRYVGPMREVVTAVLRGDLRVIEQDRMAPYFQDVYDHVLRTTEQADALRDMVGTMLETRLAVRGNRLNVITKQVTSWAAIIAVPTAITGFYGQNLPYPGSEQPSGFWTSTVLIVAMSGGLYAAFRRKGWL